MKVLYIHGFNSAGFGNKVDAWREVFGPASVINPTLPVQPEAAMELLDYLVESLNGPDFCILGSSLGGFYAMNLAKRHNVKTMLVNTALKNVGAGLAYASKTQTNYKTSETYHYTPADFAALEALELTEPDFQRLQPHTFAYMDADDEVLPAAEIRDFFVERKIYARLFPGGSHRFEHMAEAIADFREKVALM